MLNAIANVLVTARSVIGIVNASGVRFPASIDRTRNTIVTIDGCAREAQPADIIARFDPVAGKLVIAIPTASAAPVITTLPSRAQRYAPAVGSIVSVTGPTPNLVRPLAFGLKDAIRTSLVGAIGVATVTARVKALAQIVALEDDVIDVNAGAFIVVAEDQELLEICSSKGASCINQLSGVIVVESFVTRIHGNGDIAIRTSRVPIVAGRNETERHAVAIIVQDIDPPSVKKQEGTGRQALRIALRLDAKILSTKATYSDVNGHRVRCDRANRKKRDRSVREARVDAKTEARKVGAGGRVMRQAQVLHAGRRIGRIDCGSN